MDFTIAAGFTYTLTIGNTTGPPLVNSNGNPYYYDGYVPYNNGTGIIIFGPGPACVVPVNITVIAPTAGGLVRLGSAVHNREEVGFPSNDQDDSTRIPPLTPPLGTGPPDLTPSPVITLPTLPIIGR